MDRKMVVVALALALTASSVVAQQGRAAPSDPDGGVAIQRRELAALSDQLAEVRRDQLNYKVEKDLLKETYGTSLQTINTGLALGLGLLAVLGFLGLKSINDSRREFHEELKRLRKLRETLVVQARDLRSQQAKARQAVGELSNKAAEQEGRLKILELQEKIQSLNANNQFVRALEYLGAALLMAPGDPVLLRQRMTALIGLRRHDEVIATGIEILNLDPTDIVTIENIAESYLLAGRLDDYASFFGKHADAIRAGERPLLPLYFEGLALLLRNDVVGLKEHIRRLVASVPPSAGSRIPGWRYDEVRSTLAPKQASLLGYQLFAKFLEFLEGTADNATLLLAIDAAQPADEPDGPLRVPQVIG